MVTSRVINLVALATISSALVDHDGWEFYGGRRKHHRHGLNLATADAAPRAKGNIRFDTVGHEKMTELLVTNDEAPAAAAIAPNLLMSSERIKSKEQLLLSDRYSVLSFDSKYESDESPWWGRMYINGFPNSIQYFRGEFGQPPPERTVKLVLATPLNMCDEMTGLPALDNADEVDELTVVVTMRGHCTFGEKALAAHGIGAAGILFVNDQDGLFHPSAPEARDIGSFFAMMISRHDGNHLIHALGSVAEAAGPKLNGRFVPIWCHNTNSESYCKPAFDDDSRFEASLNYRGKLYADDGVEFEYVQGEFGTWINPLAEWKTMVPSVIGGDAHCCKRDGFVGEHFVVENTTAMLCLRGKCDFLTKAENVAGAMGAGMMIVSSYNSTLTRMGCNPPIRGRKVDVAVVMVTSDAYENMAIRFYSELEDGSNSSIRLIQKI